MKRTFLFTAALAVALAPQAASAADVGPGYLPRPVAVPKYAPPPPCYVIFHAHRNGLGASLTRHGPEAMPRLGQLRFADGRSLNNDVLSITTGPGTAIELYRGRQFRRFDMSLGPAQMINLNRPKIDSYRISCLAPRPVY